MPLEEHLGAVASALDQPDATPTGARDAPENGLDPTRAILDAAATVVRELLGPVAGTVATTLDALAAVLASVPGSAAAALAASAAVGLAAARRARFWRFVRIALMEGRVQDAPLAARLRLKAAIRARRRRHHRAGDGAASPESEGEGLRARVPAPDGRPRPRPKTVPQKGA